MSLDYDYSAVEDKTAILDDAGGGMVTLKPHLEAAIWALLSVSMTEITTANLHEVYQRIHMYEHARGAMRKRVDDNDQIKPQYFTAAELKTLVGLRTNVSTKTRAQFNAYLVKLLADDAKSDWDREPL
jgi:hypothetical protein